MSWSKEEKGLVKRFTFLNQTELAEFVLKIAALSDKENHHADMTIVYNKLELSLITHDKGCITEQDWKMSTEIDRIKKGG